MAGVEPIYAYLITFAYQMLTVILNVCAILQLISVLDFELVL